MSPCVTYHCTNSNSLELSCGNNGVDINASVFLRRYTSSEEHQPHNRHGGESSSTEFGDTDYAVLVLMLVASVLIGVYSVVKNGRRVTVNDYLLGGRNMSPLAVSLSLLGGWISAMSILGK